MRRLKPIAVGNFVSSFFKLLEIVESEQLVRDTRVELVRFLTEGFLVKDASDDLASLLAILEVPCVCLFRQSRISLIEPSDFHRWDAW